MTSTTGRLGAATICACGAALALAPGALALGPSLPGGVSVPPLPISTPGGVQTPLPGGVQVPCVPPTPLTPETCPAGTAQPPGSGGGAAGGAGGGSNDGSSSTGARGSKVTLKIPRQRIAVVLAKGLKVTVRSNAAGVLAVKVVLPAGTARKLHLGRKPLVLGRASGRLAKPGAKTFRVRISKKAKKALARTRSVKLSVSVTATDSAGHTGKAAVRRASVRR
jgi:hypothetical protein